MLEVIVNNSLYNLIREIQGSTTSSSSLSKVNELRERCRNVINFLKRSKSDNGRICVVLKYLTIFDRKDPNSEYLRCIPKTKVQIFSYLVLQLYHFAVFFLADLPGELFKSCSAKFLFLGLRGLSFREGVILIPL